jgi:hypothetical protein
MPLHGYAYNNGKSLSHVNLATRNLPHATGMGHLSSARPATTGAISVAGHVPAAVASAATSTTTIPSTYLCNTTPAQQQHPKQFLATAFLNKFLDFPLLSSENAQNYVQERNELFSLLRSFASTSTTVPVHLLLFPEGCPEGDDRRAMIAKSIEFAKRDGRPQLKHLLLPRTTGFYASLESLREASTVVYDVTMA